MKTFRELIAEDVNITRKQLGKDSYIMVMDGKTVGNIDKEYHLKTGKAYYGAIPNDEFANKFPYSKFDKLKDAEAYIKNAVISQI